MTGFDRLLQIRLVVAFIGAAAWFVGVRNDHSVSRVVGMVLMAVALLLRFLPKRFLGADDAS